MTDTLVDPQSIPTLDDVDFEDLHDDIGTIRSSAGDVENGGSAIDGQWATGMGAHYVGWDKLAEVAVPVKENAASVATSCQGAADALQAYAHTGASIKKALKQLKRDAEDLVAKAKPLGESWRHKQELVDENDRIKRGVRSKVRAHHEAQQHAADKIHATNDGPGTDTAGRIAEYVSWAGLVNTGLGHGVTTRTQLKLSRFAPRDAQGNYVRWKGESRWRNARRAMDLERNWQAPKDGSLARAKWIRIGKWSGGLGTGITIVTTAGTQWSQDSQDPHMSTGKKVERTAFKTGGTAGGAWAGAQGGAQLGAGIGFFFGGPAGSATGALVGGIIGGVVGSDLGSKGGDKLNEHLVGR